MKEDFELPLKREEIRNRICDGMRGCYAAFDVAGKCLYVGRAKNLLVRVLQHYINQRDGSGTKWRIGGCTEWYFKAAFAPDGCVLKIWQSDDFIALENKLIEILNPTHNHRPKKYDLKVMVTNSRNQIRPAVVIGESADKQCWRVTHLDRGTKTQITYHKSRCQKI